MRLRLAAATVAPNGRDVEAIKEYRWVAYYPTNEEGALDDPTKKQQMWVASALVTSHDGSTQSFVVRRALVRFSMRSRLGTKYADEH